jgi:hypothetical protein
LRLLPALGRRPLADGELQLGPAVHEASEHIGVYASSEWAERAFCKLATGEYFVPAGVFDSQDFELASQIYVDKKPAYYDFANHTPMLTEQQVIEQYAPPGDGS